MNELFERFVTQIDGLVPFLALAHEKVFNVTSNEMTAWFEPEEHPSILDDFQLHKEQVAHAAFLLGYSYFEAFVTDLIWSLYRERSEFLPPDGALTYESVFSSENIDDLFEIMIDKTTSGLNSLEKKLDHLQKRFGVGKAGPVLIAEAHVARNALVHNSGRINRIPKRHVRWRVGDQISLETKESYQFILAFKRFAHDLLVSAERLLANKRNSPN